MSNVSSPGPVTLSTFQTLPGGTSEPLVPHDVMGTANSHTPPRGNVTFGGKKDSTSVARSK